MTGAATIRAVVCYNPLDPSDRSVGELAWRPDVTLADLLAGLPSAVEWSAFLNGEAAPTDQWATIKPSPGSHLVVVPAIRGGRTGKAVLRVAATIAVAVAAYQVGGLVPGGITGFWGATAAAATPTIGTMSINARIFP